jgi:hypothetical protein
MRKRVTIIVSSLALGLGLIYLLFVGYTSHTPNPAPPQVCERFAVALMKRQSFHSPNCTIKTGAFTSFPVRSHHFPAWFDVSTVKNGLLISGDDWIYAVVDRDRGRLYYYNSY